MAEHERDEHPVPLQDAVRGYFVPVLDTGAVSPVTFTELLQAVRVRWWWPLLGALAGLALAVTLAFLMRPVYHGKVVFLPAKEASSSSALGALAGNIGGLASLAGINLGGDSNEAENMAVLDRKGNTIPGVYAAGVIADGHQGQTYCYEVGGCSVGFAVNSGRIAGENAARYALKQ